jgi:DNA sulfur modification protein DndE
MVFKIKTSKKTQEYFEEIAASIGFAPFILAKLSISASLKSKDGLQEKDFRTDSLGLELNRQTITGEWDELYKSLIEMYEHKHLNDDEYFQKYLKAHLDRGAKLIYSEFKYNKDFLLALISSENGI